jgi:hypothetical protein
MQTCVDNLEANAGRWKVIADADADADADKK